jgi:AcrR family transcriptional regulator
MVADYSPFVKAIMVDSNQAEIIALQVRDAAPIAKRADAIANRELILATAQRLFAERGVANICMAAIAEAAGVGKGTLYRGFANKGELCLALMDEDMRVFQNETLQMLKSKYEQSPLSKLDHFLDSLVHFMDFHAPLLREAQLHDIFQNDAYAQHTSPQMWLPWLRESIAVLLQQAEEQGEASNLDIPYLVDAILAPLAADLFMYQREVLGFELERISRGWRRLVLTGCQNG